MRIRKSKTMGLSSAVVLLTTTLLTGCTGAQNQTGDSDKGMKGAEQSVPAAIDQTPKELSVMNIYYTQEPPKDDNIALKKIAELTGTKLNVTWVPWAAYGEKINVTMASNTLPQALLVYDVKASAVISSARSGMFWDIGPLLANYPNLSKNLLKEVIANASIDGKLYGLPRKDLQGRTGLQFRKDWLDNLGMKEPETLDDLYKMLVAFTKNDPDKNGKNDTIGLSLDRSYNTVWSRSLFTWHGAPNGWEIKDGKMSPEFMAQGYLDTVNFLKKLYDEGLVNSDFPVTQSFKDNINKNKAGAGISALNHPVDGSYSQLYALVPRAEVNMTYAVAGPKGKQTPALPGFHSQFMFSKSEVKTEAELKQILNFFNKLADKDLSMLLDWGIEGVHYKVEANGPTVIDNVKFNEQINPVKMMSVVNNSSFGTSTPIARKLIQMYSENEKYLVHDPSLPLISNTLTERKTDLDKIIYDAMTKYITGQINLDGWKAAIEQWRKQGGDKVIAEFTEQYNQFYKK